MVRTKSVLGVLAIAVVLASCAEQSTVGPNVDARYDGHLDNLDSPPPPPPVDTLAAQVSEEGGSSRIFDVTLFINRTETVAWLHFDGEGTTSDAHVLIRGGNTIIGTGELTLLNGDKLALSGATAATSSLDRCETTRFESAVSTTDGTSRTIGACGNVVFKIGDTNINVAVGVPRVRVGVDQ